MGMQNTCIHCGESLKLPFEVYTALRKANDDMFKHIEALEEIIKKNNVNNPFGVAILRASIDIESLKANANRWKEWLDSIGWTPSADRSKHIVISGDCVHELNKELSICNKCGLTV